MNNFRKIFSGCFKTTSKRKFPRWTTDPSHQKELPKSTMNATIDNMTITQRKQCLICFSKNPSNMETVQFREYPWEVRPRPKELARGYVRHMTILEAPVCEGCHKCIMTSDMLPARGHDAWDAIDSLYVEPKDTTSQWISSKL